MTLAAFLRANAAWLAAGFLLNLISSFGQTFFISVFAGEIRSTFGLSNGQWGGIYTLGTTASALVMVQAGVLTDRYRVRSLGAVVLGALALACLAMAAVPGPWVLVAVIFALRFTGQGMTSHLSLVAMARWFTATRGKALAISRLGFSVGEALLPLGVVALLAVMHWRAIWVGAAVIALVAIPLLAMLLGRERTPGEASGSDAAAGMGDRHWTRGAMLKNRVFWLAVPLILGPPAFNTALFFHQVHLTEVKHWPLIGFVSLIPVFSGVSLISMFASGWAVDRIGARRLIPWVLLPYVVGFALLGRSDTLAAAGLAMGFIGLANGTLGTVVPAFWAETYGTRHIGSIKSLLAALMVFGSAVGPGATGLLIDMGFPLPSQMLAIAAYFALAAAMIGLAVWSLGRNGAEA